MQLFSFAHLQILHLPVVGNERLFKITTGFCCGLRSFGHALPARPICRL